MLLHPCCKINLGLRVLRKRPDGYHDLETIFLPVPFLHDDLEITPQPAPAHSSPKLGEVPVRAEECVNPVTFTLTGIALDSDPANNLCVKAYRLLKADFPDLPPVHIRLHKRIPFGAGLGGGSADAAFTLKGLNDLFALGLTVPQLEAYAARLGADCAFFIQCRPALAEGIGDKLTPLDLNENQNENQNTTRASQFSILNSQFSISNLLLVKPPDAVSTREAYANLKLNENQNRASQFSILNSQFSITNDFEASVFPAHPGIAQLKAELLAQGATYASMSGSGSTVYGFFPDRETLLAAADTLRRTRSDCILFHE